jgi:hypothetical protein
MKILLSNALAILLLLTTNANAQLNDGIKFADLLFPATHQITKPKFVSLSKEEIVALDGFIDLNHESLKQRFEELRKKDADYDYNLNELSGFKRFDLGKGKDGLIYSSYFGSEEMHNLIWMKQGNRYKFSGELTGKIVKMFRDTDKQPFSIVTRSGWCCVPVVGAFNLYNPTDDAGIISYKLIKSIQEHIRVKMPEARMEQLKFRVKEERYRLREAPEIDDKPYPDYPSDVEGVEIIGNILAEFKKGSTGTAIAEHDDNTGRKWWFVIMEPHTETSYTRFHDDEEGKKQYTMGWMSSRYLEIIK